MKEFEFCPKCGVRKNVGEVCYNCGTSGKAKKAAKKPAAKKPVGKKKPRKA